VSVKLAFVASHPIQYQAPLFRELSRRPGVDFQALFLHDHGVKPSLDPQFGRVFSWDIPLLEGYEHRFLTNVALRPGVSPFGQVNPELLSSLWAGEFDAVIVHGYNVISTMGAAVSPRRRTRVLLRGENHRLEPRSLVKRAIKQIVLRAVFSRVDHFLPIGSLSREYFRAFGVVDSRMTIAPYSVDNDFFTERSQPAREHGGEVRARYGLPEGIPLFLFAAKLLPKKRPLDLVRAFAEARLGGRAGVVYVGDGELSAALAVETERLGLRESVFRLGFRNQKEMPLLYGACDALVLPSDIEPWGLAVNEAMACGAAPIVSNVVGAARDLIRDPECIFPAGDVPRLAQILARVVNEPHWLARLRSDAAVRIREWTIRHTADGCLAGARAALERPARWW
jgi:glycosyltransferase involved in cell wall biosynthesis